MLRLTAGGIAGRDGFHAAVVQGAATGGVVCEHAVKGVDVAARFGQIPGVVIPVLGEIADGALAVLFEDLRSTVGLVGAEAEGAEDVDAKVEGVAEGLAVEGGDPALWEPVGVDATGGAGEDFQVWKMLLDGFGELDGLGLVVDGADDELRAGGVSRCAAAGKELAEVAG